MQYVCSFMLKQYPLIIDVEIFNMQGHSVYRNFFDETTARISTYKFTSGVYISFGLSLTF